MPASLPAVLIALLILLAPSCKLLSSAANAPAEVANTLMGGKANSTGRSPRNVLQGGLMRFSDTFAARVAQASDEFAEKAATPEARIQAMGWAIRQTTAALTIAAGPNPNVGLLDMVVLVTLSRMAHEEYFLPKVWGEADRPMVEALKDLEQDIWGVTEQLLTQEQQQEIRQTLREWRDQHPDMGSTSFVRLPAFEDILESRTQDKKRGTRLGDLLSVDPLAGLEPAVREIEQARLLAERSMFYLQRAPLLLSAEVELLSMKLLRMPEIHSALEDSERISKAASSLADLAVELPEAVRVEREAAVKQISDELALQRQGLVADLEKAREPAEKLLIESRATLETGARMSTALQGAITSLDAFLAGLRKEEPAPGAPPPAPSEPGKPFDVTEYGEAAHGVEAAARELKGLVASIDRSLPRVQRALDGAVEDSRRVVDHAFVRGLQLGSILIGLGVLAVLVLRWISARILPSRAARTAG